MTTRTTFSKRDANTLVTDPTEEAQQGVAKRLKKDATAQKDDDEFDSFEQGLDDEALLAAAEEVESAASNLGSSQPDPVASSSSQDTASSSKPTTAKPATSSTLRQATLFPSKPSPSQSSTNSVSQPTISPPSDPTSDPLWLERQTMSSSWYQLLLPEMSKPYFSTTLKSFLLSEDRAGKKTYPPPSLIYSWSRLVPSPQHVRVVVVGQDPYHGPNQACGLSFSVPKGIPIPPSLKNIYKELTTEYSGNFKPPTHGCLDGWAKQGVLMLNACLTVSAGNAASHHGKGWEGLTKSVLKMIADEAANSGAAKNANSKAVKESKIATMFAKVKGEPTSAQSEKKEEKKEKEVGKKNENDQVENKGVVFLIWGAPAAKTLAEAGVTDKNPNILILKSPHPSPLSAHRGFLGNGHFKKANEWLKQRYGDSGMIDWSQL